MDFLQMSAESFLSWYIVIFVWSFLVAAIARHIILFQPYSGLNQEEFDHYDIAYLTGGAQATFLTAVAQLCNANVLHLSKTLKTLELSSDVINTSNLHHVELRLVETVKWNISKDISKIFSGFESCISPIKERLVRMKLRPSPLKDCLARLSSAAIIGYFPVAYGLPRMFAGMEKHKPIGYLLLLTIVSAFCVFRALGKGCLRTTLGDKVLKMLKEEHRALELNFKHCRTSLTGSEAALGYALFGGMVGTLVVGSMDPYASAKAAMNRGLAGGGSGGSSCAGGGGCGSSCGGGGCGGGCGGCGG